MPGPLSATSRTSRAMLFTIRIFPRGQWHDIALITQLEPFYIWVRGVGHVPESSNCASA
jgi:hypothetical protein